MSKHRHSAIHHHAAYVWRELTLQQMLDDAIVQDVMRSDRVCRSDIEAIFKALRPTALRVAA